MLLFPSKLFSQSLFSCTQFVCHKRTLTSLHFTYFCIIVVAMRMGVANFGMFHPVSFFSFKIKINIFRFSHSCFFFKTTFIFYFCPSQIFHVMRIFAATLYLVYHLKVSQLYSVTASESSSSIHSKGSGDQHNDEPFAIQHINLCARSRILAVSTLCNAVIVYRFRSKEAAGEIVVSLLFLLFSKSSV